MIVMDWIRKLTDIIMPLEDPPVMDEEDTKEAKKSNAKIVEVKQEQMRQEAQFSQNAAQTVQATKQTATAGGFGGTTSFTQTSGMVNTADSGVTSMDGVRYEAYNSEASVRPSLAVVKTPQLTMKIYAPKKYDEQVKQIVDDLRTKNAIIVNYEGVDMSEQQRIGDFIIGAVYMIKGKAEKVSNRIFLYVPSGIEYENTANSLRHYN